MFALKSGTEVSTRILLTVVILFNALVPTAAVSSLSPARNQQLSDSTSGHPGFPVSGSPNIPQQINFQRLPLNFIANVGQFDKNVQFQTSTLGGSIAFTPSEVILALMDKKIKLKYQENDSFSSTADNSKVVRIEYKNAENDPLVEGMNLLPGVANFMVGSDKKAWVADAPMYDGIVYRNLYAGIDLKFEGAGHSLKSTFTVASGADPSLIQWRYKGAGEITLDEQGNLLITLPATEAGQTNTTLIEHKPIAWQEVNGQHGNVPVQYTLNNNGEISFVFPQGYDASLPLIIDPTLTYGTYLGNTGTDVGNAITTDADGNAYITGYSYCGNFPIINPIQQGKTSGRDVIISKISADGSTLLYSTCVAGAGDDYGTGIALDSQGRIVVGGMTNSTGFPIVSGIATYGGDSGCTTTMPCQDSFVLALNAQGNAIRYSSYLGGSGREELGSIAIDGSDNILLVGSTTSSNFPTVQAYDNTYSTGGTCSDAPPCYDVTVTKLDPNLSGMSAILYSTYLGGIHRDRAFGFTLDSSGKVYLIGSSTSDDFPTRNALQGARQGSDDVIVTQIDPSLSGDASLLYSSYFGTTNADVGYSIARDADGSLYLTGNTKSDVFPLHDPLQSTSHISQASSLPGSEVFVTKLDISTNTLVYSTYLGGSENDDAYGINVDSYNRAYVVGTTRSNDFPTHNAIQSTKGADGCDSPPCLDAFLSVIEPDGQAFAYSTYLGGDYDDVAFGVSMDQANNVYVIGQTYSSNFPTTPGAYDVINTTTNKLDAFITKVGALGPPATPTFTPSPTVTSTSTDTATATLTATDTPTNTATFTPTNTPTRTATPTSTSTPTKAPPPGLNCIDWRDGLQHGWLQSPWVDSQAQIQLDSNGMYGSANDTGIYQVGAYFQMPAGGPYKVVIAGQNLANITVAQGADSPTSSGPLSNTVTANPDRSYSVTAAYLEVQWFVTAPIDLASTPLFQTFCYSAFTPTATSTSTATNTPSATPTFTNTPTYLSDLMVQQVDTSALIVDGQTLTVSGSLSAEITNIGSEGASRPFKIIFFEDRNGNGNFDEATDILLGSTIQNDLPAGAAVTVTLSASGQFLFTGNLVYAFVDSEDVISETDETNNINQNTPACEFVPSTEQFAPLLEWQWTGGSTLPTSNQVMMAPGLADLNGDGIPEIIFTSFAGGSYGGNNHLRAISGRDGSEVFTVTDPNYDLWGVGGIAVGDIDLDGRYEIVAVDEQGNRLIAFEHDGTFKWRSPSISGGIDRGGPAIADLNGDAIPEIVIGSTVLNNNGVIQWVGAYGKGNNHNGPLSLVADLDLDGQPEVVAGNTAYHADGTIYWNNTSLTDGFNAVADFTADGFPEVVLVDAGKVYLLDHTGGIIWGPVSLPGGGAGGAPTIADVDNDGLPEIGVAGASRYVVFETNGTIKWSSVTQDGSSHSTGSSVFDFEADGSTEIIYRDEIKLRVYGGSDGAVLWETPNTSGTTYELPVIADVDADGNAEIVMVSNNYNHGGGTTGIQVYGDSADQWVGTRQLWNQHTYHITNINDDGSIPADETNNWEVYNNYRQNVLTSGCVYAQPDLTASYVRKQVNETTITITARLGNGGGVVAGSNVPVSFYNGDPRAGGNLLGTSHTTLYLQPGEFEDVTISLPAGTVALPIWVVADDSGAGQGILTESNESNNFYNSHVYLTLTLNQPPVVDAGSDQQLFYSGGIVTASLAGVASDDGQPASILTHTWALVSGLGSVELIDPTSLQTTVTFDQAGVYVLRLTASDDDLTRSDELTITITSTITPTPTGTPQTPPLSELVIPGWIESPAQQSMVSGVVSITLVNGITLQNGTVDFWPVNDLTQVKVLATVSNKSGGDTLAALDTTTLANGSYVIRLQGTNSAGLQQDSGVMITVSGEYKPGRVRFTITDLTIPVAGLPITIARTYDSLERNQVGDFGYGWSLAVGNPKLETNPAHDVTLTMPDGRRSTFYFTPLHYGGVFGYFMYPHYTPDAGVYGSLSSNGCDMLILSSGQYYCFLEGDYHPTEYTYTDPYGRKFLMDADGTLKTITDLNDNVLTFSPNGITSSAGNINVPFVRDGQGRITNITFPAGKEYLYGYDVEGNLETVTFPNVTVDDDGGQASTSPSGHYASYIMPQTTQQEIMLQYHYYPGDHFFQQTTDPLGNDTVITTYDSNGRLESITDAAGNQTTYTYDLETRTTTVNFIGDPDVQTDDSGSATLMYDEAGYITNYTDVLGNETIYTYDENHNLTKIKNPLTHETRFTYNDQGHTTSITDPLDITLASTDYNQYGSPTTLRTAQGGDDYPISSTYEQGTFRLSSMSDSYGSLGSYTWWDDGNPKTFTNQYGETTNYTYTAQGHLETETDPLGQVTRYRYDDFGRVTEMKQAYGLADEATTLYQYDELGRLTKLTVADGTSDAATTRFQYDANGNRTAVIDPIGRRTEYHYDSANRLEFVIYAAHDANESTTTKYVYDVHSRLTDVIVAFGTSDASTTHYVYDPAGRATDVTTAFGTSDASTTHYVYNAAGYITDATVAYGTSDAITAHYQYDSAEHVTDITIGYGTTDASTTHYEYYDSGLVERVTTAYGTSVDATTMYFYDRRGRPTVTVYPDGTTTTQFYDPMPTTPGWKHSILDQAGVRTSYVYDASGRLDQLINSAIDPQTSEPFERVSTYDYDAADRLTDVYDPEGSHASFTYDDADHIRTSTTWLDATTGYTSVYGYDLAGEQVSFKDANDHTTSFDYNELGLLETTTYAGSVITSQTYDKAGRQVTFTDENGIVTRYTYDAASRLASTTLGYGTENAAATQYDYNAANQLASITDALTHVTRFEYNDAGQLIKKILPDTTSYEQYGYNPAGNLASYRMTDGTTNTFDYDSLNRLTEIAYFDGTYANFTYTPGGQRDTASTRTQFLAPPQVTDSDYDPFQRLEQVTGPDGRAVSYTYYDNDLRKTMTTPAGTVTYGYDGLNQLTSISAGANQTTTFEYDPVGFLTDIHRPNGVDTAYTPNVRNQIDLITHSNASGTLQSFDYLLDNAGNRKKVTEADGSTISWGYDKLYRLTDEEHRNSGNGITSQSHFEYDAVGNWDWTTINGVTTDYSYNVLDQLVSAGSANYDYDGRGNLEQITNGSQVTTYTYDAANRLTNVSIPGMTASYNYDAAGHRVSQTLDGQITNYLWDEASPFGDVVLETDGSGATLASYILAGTQLISQTRSGATSYYLQDGQGSVRGLTNAAGTLIDSYAYSAFGETLSHTGTTTNPYQYAGQQFDAATGLYNLRARNYDPSDGRFLSQDVYPYNLANPIELNRYSYAANSPINYSDPTGYFAFAEYSVLNTGKAVAKGALGGALIGGASDALIQLLTQPLNEFSWKQVLQSTVAGAVSGAFGALTGIGGAAKGLTLAKTVLYGSVEGLLSGMLSRGVMNLFAGNDFFDGYSLYTAFTDAFIGGLTSGIFYGIGRVFSQAIQKIAPLTGGAGDTQLPSRLARVIPAKFLDTTKTLGAPEATDVLITSADDIAGISTSRELAQRLSLFDKAGRLIRGPFGVIEFDAVDGLAVPILRDAYTQANLAFIGRGYTLGGASEYMLPNLSIDSLMHVVKRTVQ